MRTVLAVLMVAASTQSALAQDGRDAGCDAPAFNAGWLPGTERKFDGTQFRVFAIKPRVPLFREAWAENMATTGRTLAFSEPVYVIDPGTLDTPRLRVRLPDDQTGWVNRNDLLCRRDPLRDVEPLSPPGSGTRGTGLPRRMVVKTATAETGQSRAKTAYHSPTRECQGGPGTCVQVSKLKWYFVYLEQNDHVLLGERPNMAHPASRFLGWLPKEDGIAWNTAVGLRPAEEPAVRTGPRGTSDMFACLFADRAGIGNPEKCMPLLGGKQWFELDTRLTVLEDDRANRIYTVAGIAAATTSTFDAVFSRLRELSAVDVFFVIDGTASMQPAIDAISGTPGRKGLVERLRERLAAKLAQGGKLRLGYRVYRDSVRGGPDGVRNSEALPLPSNNCESNIAQFQESFSKVKAYDPAADPDFAENTFGGLLQASDDMASCPGHLKVVFMIGDHGYDARAQEQKGFTSISIDQLANRYRRTRDDPRGVQPLVTVIQTAATQALGTGNDYDRAYASYKAQGEEFLKKVYQGVKLPESPEKYFHRLSATTIADDMIDRIMGPVDALLNPVALAELEGRIHAGESLTDAIRRITTRSRVMPAILFGIVAPDLCPQLGPRCRDAVFEASFVAYLPYGTDLESDVLLSHTQYKDWEGLLRSVRASLERGGQTEDREVRNQVVRTFIEAIGSRLNIVIDDTGLTLGEFVAMRGGLPHGRESALLTYTPQELRDPDKVPSCEIEHILRYADAKLRILQAAADGDTLITFSERPIDPAICPRISATGRRIPDITGRPILRPLNRRGENTNYKYRWTSGGDFYWMPSKYLP